MTPNELKTLLDAIQQGTVTADDAHDRLLDHLRQAPYEDLGFARVDHHRPIRQGFPEVIAGVTRCRA